MSCDRNTDLTALDACCVCGGGRATASKSSENLLEDSGFSYGVPATVYIIHHYVFHHRFCVLYQISLFDFKCNKNIKLCTTNMQTFMYFVF